MNQLDYAMTVGLEILHSRTSLKQLSIAQSGDQNSVSGTEITQAD